MLYLLGEELKIIDIIKKYDKLDEEYYMGIKEEIKEHPKEDYTFIEQKHYKKLKQKVQKALEGVSIYDAYTLKEPSFNSRIIPFTSGHSQDNMESTNELPTPKGR